MYAEIVILAMLRQSPQHGYELKKAIDLAFGGTIPLNNKVLYTALKQFEASGAVVRQVIPQEGKPPRHVYQLTEHGDTLLHRYLCDFPQELAANAPEFFTRVAFFDYLKPEEQRAILQQRLAHIESALGYLAELHKLADTTCPTEAAQRVLAFHLHQTQGEQQWITTWLNELA
jgi:DNA-binding PadR family transcriptional regulator